MNIYTLGADPEFFIEKEKELYSIEGLLGGTKQNPKYLDDLGVYKVQEDNVAAEYNIPPCQTKDDFIESILTPQRMIMKIIGTDKFNISLKASGNFPLKQLNTEQAQTFGCDPDYNAWTLTMNEAPRCNDASFRSCGGHIHFGYKTENPLEIADKIKAMDHFLGVWSVIADQDQKRKQLYGKAGAFRLQPHGGEYRTLSNFWIFSPALISEVWDRTQAALNLKETPSEEQGQIIQNLINTGNINGSRLYLKTHGLL